MLAAVVGGESFVVGSFKYGGIEAFLGEVVDFGEELPGPGDGFFAEVVAKRPVAEHFEEGVVVGVVSYVFEVVVFACNA